MGNDTDFKKISMKGIPLLLAFSLIVSAVGMVPATANAAMEDRTAGTAVEEVAADQAKAAGEEAEQPAAEEAWSEQPAEEEESADEQPEAEEQEQTQFDARAKRPVLPADWEEKMKEFFPDENLRRIVKEKFESGEAYRGGTTTEAVLQKCQSFTLKLKNLCEGDPANVKDLTGIEKLAQKRSSSARITVTYSSPCMDMSLWETLAQKLPEKLPRGGLAVVVDYVGVIPVILTASGIEDYGGHYPGTINLPKFMGFRNTQEFYTETVKLNYVRSNDSEKDVTIDLGVQKRKSVGSADLEGVINAGHTEILTNRGAIMDPQDPDKYAEQIPGVMESIEKNQDGNYVKLRLFGKSLYDPNGNLYAYGYGFNQYDNFGNGSTTTNALSYSYRYPFEPVYYSALNWEIQSQLYSGFKFKKTNSDGTQSLAGAQYIVSRKKQAVYSIDEANALSKSWLVGTPKYEKAADGSVDYSRPIYETDAAGQPVYEYLQQEGQKDPYQAAVFTTDQSKAHTYATGADGTFTADMIPAGSLQTATYTNADKTSSIVSTSYYVQEIKAPDGYELSTASPTEIKVTGNTSGIRLEAEGGHGDTIKDVYTKGVELKPDFSEIAETEGTPETTRYKMNVVDDNSPKTEQHATVFIRNAEDEPEKLDEYGFPIPGERDVKHITINYTKNGTDNDRYETLQSPGYKVVDLEGNAVPGLENITSVEDLSKGINKVIIDGNLAQKEKDSYNIVAAQADKQELVYYDKNWKTNYQTADSIAGVQKNDPLPVSVQFSAKKIFTGGQLKDNDFRFILAPTATVDGDPLTAPVEGYTDVMGKISFAGFPKFQYTKPGTYTYTLKEDQDWYQGPGAAAKADNITFDTSTHTVVVKVTETESAPGVTNGLTATVTVDGAKIGQEVTSTNCDKADVFELATFTNTLARDTGSLTVTKKVSGDLGDQNADWHFTVTLDDTTINGAYGDMTFVNGVAQIVLKHGESKTATDLPAGVTYTVVETEANQNGYATTATDDTGTIEKDVTKTAAFTNTYNSPLPITGGVGTTLFTLSGLGLIAVAAGALMYQYMKRRKRGGMLE